MQHLAWSHEHLRAECLEPTQPADACVIWLHGLGANGHDFVPVVPHLKLPDELNVRFLFPHAPQIPVTCNGGMRMPAWYDILALTEIREINTTQLYQSVADLRTLIDTQIQAGIATERIVLVGFSQGGAVAYHAALTHPQPLAGLIALSTYLPNPELIGEPHPAQHQLPVCVAHGQLDAMVTERAARLAVSWLGEQGYAVEWREYPMGHEVCLSELRQIGQWLTQMLGV